MGGGDPCPLKKLNFLGKEIIAWDFLKFLVKTKKKKNDRKTNIIIHTYIRNKLGIQEKLRMRTQVMNLFFHNQNLNVPIQSVEI